MSKTRMVCWNDWGATFRDLEISKTLDEVYGTLSSVRVGWSSSYELEYNFSKYISAEEVVRVRQSHEVDKLR